MPAKHLVIVGGGAAGFFCAVNAARLNKNLQVTIIEKSNKLLSKVKVSGGGRCNVTHACYDIADMSRHYPRGQNFVKKAFHHFFTTDTIQWFKERGVPIKAEADGRMFPVSDSSQSIIDCLLQEVNKYSINIIMNSEVKEIIPANNEFTIAIANQKTVTADYVCVACGGYPKASMFQWLLKLGHSIAEPIPSLFTFNLPKHPLNQLMGVSVNPVKIKIEGTKLQQKGPVLITHWGLSGPAVLRLSAWGARELAQTTYNFKAHINWIPDYTEQDIKNQIQDFRNSVGSKKINNSNFAQLPQRLWEFLITQSNISNEMRWADLPSKTENQFIKNLVDYIVDVKGKTTFKEEFVTAGGIQLNEVDVNTMMSKKVQNLFFAGEILDVDGITGGFNFQHAWTSGWIAANAIATKSI